jgi:hypothetical protein
LIRRLLLQGRVPAQRMSGPTRQVRWVLRNRPCRCAKFAERSKALLCPSDRLPREAVRGGPVPAHHLSLRLERALRLAPCHARLLPRLRTRRRPTGRAARSGCWTFDRPQRMPVSRERRPAEKRVRASRGRIVARVERLVDRRRRVHGVRSAPAANLAVPVLARLGMYRARRRTRAQRNAGPEARSCHRR